MSDGGKGSARRPEDHKLVAANWDVIFGSRKRAEVPMGVAAGTEPVVTLGEWLPNADVADAANGSEPL